MGMVTHAVTAGLGLTEGLRRAVDGVPRQIYKVALMCFHLYLQNTSFKDGVLQDRCATSTERGRVTTAIQRFHAHI